MARQRSAREISTVQIPAPELRRPEPMPVVEEPPAAPCCDNCPFWSRYLGSKLGFCRRFPPTVVNPTHLTSSGPVVIHGLTSAEIVCGEHPRFKS